MEEDLARKESDSSFDLEKVPMIFKILRNQPRKRKVKPDPQSPRGKQIEQVQSPSAHHSKKRKKTEKKMKIIDTTSTKSHNSGTDEETSQKPHSNTAITLKNYTPETSLISSDMHDDTTSQENYLPTQSRVNSNSAQILNVLSSQNPIHNQSLRTCNWGNFQSHIPSGLGVINQISQKQPPHGLSTFPPIPTFAPNQQSVGQFVPNRDSSHYQIMPPGLFNPALSQSSYQQQREAKQGPAPVATNEADKNAFEQEKGICFSSDDEREDLFEGIKRRESFFLPSPNQAKIIDYHDYFDRDSDLKI